MNPLPKYIERNKLLVHVKQHLSVHTRKCMRKVVDYDNSSRKIAVLTEVLEKEGAISNTTPY